MTEAAAMNLQIRDPRARKLARRVAERDGTSMTAAVVKALEAEAARPRETLVESIERIQEELLRISRPGGRALAKEEIDEMWGHPPDGSEE